MPTGVYKRTAKHTRASMKALRRAWKVCGKKPRTKKQIRAFKKAFSLGRKVAHESYSRKEWNKMLTRARASRRKRKDGHCEICKKHCITQKDHCHKTGRKRGKLCVKCNLGMGLFKDSSKLLKRVIKYLEKYDK